MLTLNCRDDFVLPLVGRGFQLARLSSALISEEPKGPVVISVIGKSGVGKTKLVKERYESPATKRNFEVKAWVTCAPNLSGANIMKLILLCLVEGPLR
jgi:type II secretory pathway predicted ATPase ExeA